MKRGLKKQLITTLDAPQDFRCEATREREARSAAQNTALMRALGLAHHWLRPLDEQRAASVAEIAEAEGMDVTRVRRVMRLTLLAPEVVERLVGSPDAVLEKVMRRPWPNGWGDQMRVLAPPRSARRAQRQQPPAGGFFAASRHSVATATGVAKHNRPPLNPRQQRKWPRERSRDHQRKQRIERRRRKPKHRLRWGGAREARPENRANTGGAGKKNPNR